jgi:hypothetical protein
MFLPRILLCLFLLAPFAGLAQGSGEAPAPAATPPESEALPPPPLVPAAEAPEDEPAEGEIIPREYGTAQEPGKPFTVGRGVFEFIGGGVMGAGVGFLSLLLGAAVFAPTCDSDSCIIPIFLTGAMGASFGIPLGVYGAGRLQGGQGRYWPAFLGTIVGAGLGALTSVISNNETATAVSLTAGPVLGAIVGYELSHSYVQRRLTPTLGLSLTGGVVAGLSGRF